MSLDVAYSIEADDYVDPDRACDLYWSGVITSKRGFLCPGTDCEAQVTCANLDEDLQNMRVVPHFRIYGTHAESCEIGNQLPLDFLYEPAASGQGERQTVDKSIVDVFELKRPDSYYDEPRSDARADVRLAKKRSKGRTTGTQRLAEGGGLGTVYSVRSVVSRYIRYKNDGSLKLRRINVAGQDVQYSSIFRCIWEQDLDDLPDHPVIYYGWAYIDRTKNDNAYRIRFKKNLKRGNESLGTSSFVSDAVIAQYKLKKLMGVRLSKICKQAKPTGYVFLYGQPTVRVSNGRSYANFDLNNLDMIDVNYDCPLPPKYDR
jgi:hypothetical protein